MNEQIYGWIYGLQSPKGKWYIGQTTKEPYGYIKDNYEQRKGIRRPKLKRAIEKYGFENFKVVIIDHKFSEEALNDAEIFYIKKYNCLGHNGYNCREGGAGGKLDEQSKKKISESRKLFFKNGGVNHWKGKALSEETRKKLSLARMGQVPSNKGIPMSDEQKKLISKNKIESGVAKGVNNPRAIIRTIRNIETGEEHTGILTELSKKFNFSRIAILKGRTGKWQLINKVDTTTPNNNKEENK